MELPNRNRRDPAHSVLTLPEPDPLAQAHSARLLDLIRGEIARWGGVLPFDRFMELALYAPGLGYYVAGNRKLGAEGDFVTAPEVSPLFGRCLARQCAQVLAALGGGDILEFGAGSGALAAVLLDELKLLDCPPRRYLILETSPELRERQQGALAGRAEVEWRERPPPVLRGVAIANEVLDAMPVHRFTLREGEMQGLGVGWDGVALVERTCAASPDLKLAVAALQAAGYPLGEGYCSEVNLRAAPWIATLGEILEAGVALLIDYGYPGAEYYRAARSMGTLMCHYRHRAHPDPYRLVGLQDITAHVDFSRVAQAGTAAGLNLLGYATQAHFLLACGLDQLLAESDPEDTQSHLRLVQGAKYLVMPTEMGERFQVLALGRNVGEPLLGFTLRDLRGRL
jgi:SAM-dependent MidA family methyltransferase